MMQGRKTAPRLRIFVDVVPPLSFLFFLIHPCGDHPQTTGTYRSPVLSSHPHLPTTATATHWLEKERAQTKKGTRTEKDKTCVWTSNKFVNKEHSNNQKNTARHRQ